MRFSLLLILLVLSSCSNQKAKVERESAQRTAMESFDTQFDAEGTLIFNKQNGAEAYEKYCASCHGLNGQSIALSASGQTHSLSQSALNNVRQFYRTAYFGSANGQMKGLGTEIEFHDLVDIVGYVQTLPKLGE